ncbi:MAG: hypothetical protein KGL01_09315 [Betaproteobacteria bacterium]|nr:hypothetical protein [Betaproteobacteria bacterium]
MIFLSKKDTLVVFLYSLIFLGTAIPQIAVVSALAILPFSGLAWMSGVYAVSLFKTNAAYLPAAWFAVFLQVYLVALIINFRKI